MWQTPRFIILSYLDSESVANATRGMENAMPFSALGLALLGFWAIFGLHHVSGAEFYF